MRKHCVRLSALAVAFALGGTLAMPEPAAAHPEIGTREYLISKDAAAVRTYVRQNLLYGLMCLEHAPSDKAFSSVVSALRVTKCCSEALPTLHDLRRVVEGCEGPLAAILRRHEAGRMYALSLDLATLHGAASRVLEALHTIPDADLICAYELDALYRRAAAEQRKDAA